MKNELTYTTDGKKFKTFATIKEAPLLNGFTSADEDNEQYLMMKPSVTLTATFSKEIRKSLHLAKHSKKWRVRKKHTMKLLNILVYMVGEENLIEEFQKARK
ncbi:MAG: hypothetical protein KBT03_01275 [Bacteroidales bacterium]|nr:hypothetical protein [Candidatus Scybalousia scybalohippi]